MKHRPTTVPLKARIHCVPAEPRRVLQALVPATWLLLGEGVWAQEAIHKGATELGAMSITEAASAPPAVSEQSDSYTLGTTSTATRFDLSPRQTPQSATTISREQIQDFRLDNANDLLQAGGVNVQRVETERTYFTVRGFDVNNFQLDGLGLPFSSEEQMGDIDTVLYDHVEVLKGANGLTATPGNPAATVNFVRKRPTATPQARVSLGYGSWNTHRLEGDVSGALDSAGRIRGRLIAADEAGDSYLDRYEPKKRVFAGLLAVDLNDSNTLTLGHSQQRNRPEGIMWSGLTLNYSDGSPIRYNRSYNSAPDWAYWNSDDRQSFAELTTDWGAAGRAARRSTIVRCSPTPR